MRELQGGNGKSITSTYIQKGATGIRIGLLSEPAYKEALEFMIILCADGVFADWAEKAFYLPTRCVKPAQDVLWAFGGRMFPGENFHTAMQRILKDDTGLDVPCSCMTFQRFQDYQWSDEIAQEGVGSHNFCLTGVIWSTIQMRAKIRLNPKEYHVERGLTRIGREDLGKVPPPMRDLFYFTFGAE